MPPIPIVDIEKLNLAMADRFIVLPEITTKEPRSTASHLIGQMVSRHLNPSVEKWQVALAIAKTTNLQTDRRYKNMEIIERLAFSYGKNNPIELAKLNIDAESDFDQQLLARYIVKSGIAKDRTRGLLLICSKPQADILGIDLSEIELSKLGAFILAKERQTDYEVHRVYMSTEWQQIEPSQKLLGTNK